MYIKFVMARSRLPDDLTKLEHKHHLTLKSGADKNALPGSHTW